MSKTLSIRLPDSQDRALTRKATALGRTRSQLVRESIDRSLQERPLSRSIGHLSGRLRLSKPKSGWRREIKDRNWR